MNAAERAALLPATVLFEDELAAAGPLSKTLADAGAATQLRRRGWLVRRMLLLGDLAGLSSAYLAAQLLVGGAAVSRFGIEAETLLFLLTLPAWALIAKLYGLYDRDEERNDHSGVDEAMQVFHLVTVGTWLLLAATWLGGFAKPNLPRLAAFWLLAIVAVPLARAIARSYCRRHISYLQNTVIVGAGEVGQLVARKFLQHPEYGINLVGFVDDDPMARRPGLDHLAVLGSPGSLPHIVPLLDVERVVIAFSNDSHEETLDLIRSLKELDVQIDIVPRLFEVVGAQFGVHTVEGLPLVGLPPLRLSRSSALLKRATDVVVASLSLVVLAPLFLYVAWRIKADSPGPVFFRQVRMGSGGRTFRIFKFRTMVADAEERKRTLEHLNIHALRGGDTRMFKVQDDPRTTVFGRFLRRYFLDELPQLINVLRGEMSLVGPRPLILEEDRFVGAWARRRLDLKPGMTGLWQVLGRSEIGFDEMVKLDYVYVTAWSPWNDFRLLFRTLPVVCRGARSAY